ncbi:acyl-CoA dehydrogenase family protein [Alcaligenes faecalis]|uniref:acyl-CoA dehydrogenase family protein n=1 Tax=Alcaligenes faecalis TaxID=511 RepID=UPI002932B925|nr:acyl-CoA dehydrogenase family protein [Alcaligenes faecalis]MDV2115302.1 hypothetical protein [Alcaligenes faecalis]
MYSNQVVDFPSRTSATGQTANGLYERVCAILPELEARASQTEKNRAVPAENIQLLKSTGLHRIFLPISYGGYEASLPEFAQCLVKIASACASTAWAFGLMCTHNYLLAHYPKQLQDEVWADDPNCTASSSIAPLGHYEEAEGGIVLSGTFGWSSGCDHTEWAVLGVNRRNAQGQAIYSLAVVPSCDYSIKDDWHCMAMSGSGSKSIVVDKVFVPNHRIQAIDDMLYEGRSAGIALYPDSTLFHSPYRPYFASIFAAVGLGIAEKALALFIDKNRNRKRAYSGILVGTLPPMLLRIGESTHQIKAARALMEQSWQDHRHHAEQQIYPSQRTAVEWRTEQAYAIKMCTEAVNRLFAASGGSAWLEHNPMQRLFRDVNITAAHAYTDYDLCSQAMGREQMGLPPDPMTAPAP